MLHYKACARTRKEKASDIALMVFGVLAAVYTTAQTLKVDRHPPWMYPFEL
jgi:proton-coupled amino acid transporter